MSSGEPMMMFGLSAEEIKEAGGEWTAREILQQPQVWAEIEKLTAGSAPGHAEFLAPLLARPEGRVVLTGAGTSAFIGQCLAPALARGLHRRVDAIPTTDLVASPQSFLSPATPTLMVSFGRSGNSPESVAAVRLADSVLKDCAHLIVTCDAGGALAQYAATHARARVITLPERSNDRSFAMTSSFTGMLLTGGLALGAVRSDSARMMALDRMAARVLPGRLPFLKDLVRTGFERVVYLGSKEFKGLASEAALKMLELTDGKVVAVADSPLGFRHGPKTILNGKTLVVVFASSDDYTRQYDWDLVEELRRDGVAGRVVTLSAKTIAAPQENDVVLGPAGTAELSDLELCLPYALFAQSIALLRSLSLKCRPDNPNAAGTVSRVVKGVSIHPWRASE
jgi:tagatose-6-phosphate ketose/aldose isomerase